MKKYADYHRESILEKQTARKAEAQSKLKELKSLIAQLAKIENKIEKLLIRG